MDARTTHDVAHHAGDLGARLQGRHARRRERGVGQSGKAVRLRRHRRPRPSHAPGTGTPEPGGITTADLLRWSVNSVASTMSPESTWSRSPPRTTTPSSRSTPRIAWCSKRSEEWRPAAATPPRTPRRVRPPVFVDLLDRLRVDVPVAQAGMGGGLAGPELATAVAAAGGLGTLGLASAAVLRESIQQVRDGATLFGMGWPAPHRVSPTRQHDAGATTTGTPASCRASSTPAAVFCRNLPIAPPRR